MSATRSTAMCVCWSRPRRSAGPPAQGRWRVGAWVSSFGLEQSNGVAVGILEPGRAPDARRGDDVVDRPERLGVVFLEVDARGGEFGDVGYDVGRQEMDL